MGYRINFDCFSKFSRGIDIRERHLRGLLHACILRDRVKMPYTHAVSMVRLCNMVVDLAKDKTEASYEKLDCLLSYNPFAKQKLMNQLLTRYANRNCDYVRLTKCGIDNQRGYEIGLLEFVDAPGDTMVELAKRTLPVLAIEKKKIQSEITTLKERIEEASPYIPDFSFLKPDERIKMEAEFDLEALCNKEREISNEINRLQEANSLARLPEGYVEEQWPSASQRILVSSKPHTVYYKIKAAKPSPRMNAPDLKNPNMIKEAQEQKSRGFTTKTFYRRIAHIVSNPPENMPLGVVKVRGCEGDFF